MSAAPHRSIGEVLTLLQDEFEDITISKIRFLESQGLIDPERTPSGYRKFTDADVAQLRWVLRQQREHFLPLKVIKDRLDDGGLSFDGGAEPAEPGVPAPDPAAERTADPSPSAAGDGPVALSGEELTQRTGLSARDIADLERYGLLSPVERNGRSVYDDDGYEVARAAAALRSLGVEARHLRMYKVAVEREAGYYEQLLMPMLKRRSAKGRRDAVEALDQLVSLGDQIRASLMRQAFREHLPPR